MFSDKPDKHRPLLLLMRFTRGAAGYRKLRQQGIGLGFVEPFNVHVAEEHVHSSSLMILQGF